MKLKRMVCFRWIPTKKNERLQKLFATPSIRGEINKSISESMGISSEEFRVKLVTTSPVTKSPHPRHDNDGQSYKKEISLIYPC
jgi:hypothetical protein